MERADGPSASTACKRKAHAYARGRIADYWIVNLVDRVVEVYREPARPGPARRRWGYASAEVVRPGQAIAPLAARSALIAATDLLP
jgi:hypothetical protein